MNESLVETFARHPDRAGVFVDFDGTLSELVPVPGDARPASGVPEVLARLRAIYRVVAVVSGRSAMELVDRLGPRVEIWGLHGAEHAEGGIVVLSPQLVPYAAAIEAARTDAVREVAGLNIEGILVEDKGSMFALHYRTARDRDAAGRALEEVASRLATRHGLERARGKMAFELRPPVGVSKAGVVLDRADQESLEAVLFAGDDLVDLPAFDALDELAARGVTAVRVAVAERETPPELLERADVVVEGVRGAVALLERLATSG